MNMKSRTVACGMCIAGLSFATATTGVVRTATALSENQKLEKNKIIENKAVESHVLQSQNSQAELEKATAAIMEQITTTPKKISLKIAEISKEEAERREKEQYNQTKFITNVTDGYLNVRKKGSMKGEIIGKLYVGAGGKIVQYGKKWTEIKSGKVKGYVATKYISFGDKYKEEKKKHDTIIKGITLKEEQKIIEKQRQAEEKARRREEKQRQAELEEARRQAEQSQAEQSQAEQSQADDSREAAVAVQGEEYLLACLVQAEAGGEIYEGKLAVANVVLNRVQSPSFANSITDVIYQSGQFSVVNNGSLASIMSQGPAQECVQAAQDALAGNNNVPGYLYFRSKHCSGYVETPNCQHIGNQIFYQ